LAINTIIRKGILYKHLIFYHVFKKVKIQSKYNNENETIGQYMKQQP